jgi:hypothetical protein
MVYGLWFMVYGLGFKVHGSCFGFIMQSKGLVQGLGFRV